jgi:hypothetical protein
MVDAFVRKMRLPVQKHNKRYILLTQSIIHSVFANWQTGQVVTQLLKGKTSALSASFFSELHGREINCEKFYKFMQDKVSLTILEQLQTDPAVTLQQEAIDKSAASSGLNIWDKSNTNSNAHLFQKQALQEYAAQASTQHNNERLVKLGAQMASTDKSEIMASVFAIALNDFMQEYHKETHLKPANQPVVEEQGAEEADNGPQ